MSENALQIVTKARKALALARTVDDFKEIRDQGHAALKYLKSKRDMGVDARNDVSEIVILAERGIGKMLKGLEKNKGHAAQSQQPAIERWFLIDLSAWRYHMIVNLNQLRHGRKSNGDGTHELSGVP